MAGFWPLYSNFSSKAQVTLALPGIPSVIAKSIGMTASALLLVPNIDYLIKFIEGDIGIADKAARKGIAKAISSPAAQSSEGVIRHMSKLKGLGLEDKIAQYKGPDGKIKIPGSEVNPAPDEDSLGLKAMEKAILTSIFETQKPYLEIAKLVIGVLVDIEDIVARVMPLVSISPLTFKSQKPVGNGGEGSRPKAIGYQKGQEIKAAIAQLDRISKIGGKTEVDKNGIPKRNAGSQGFVPQEGAADLSILQNEAIKKASGGFKVIDVVYSTGAYDPTADYQYTYIDLPADEGIKDQQPEPEEEEEDPYDKYKPERIILGIFDSKGVPMDPNSILYTINERFDPNQPAADAGKSPTQFRKADWILRSPKWVFPISDQPGAVVWPSFGDPIYRWERLGGLQQRESKTKPDAGANMPEWKLKKYEKGDKNEINGLDAIEGDPVIAGFETSDISVYTRYFTEYASINMRLAKDLDDAEKAEATKTIMSQLNVKSHLENVTLYSQSKSSVYRDFSVPESMKLTFKPMQITVEAAKSDPKLAGLNGRIWIDPESDYETKIIQVKPSTRIQYSEAKGEAALNSEIKSFVKNKMTFSFASGEKFNIDIRKNGSAAGSFTGVSEYVLENWNFDPATRQVSSTNAYSVSIWTSEPSGEVGRLLAANPILQMGPGTVFTQHGLYRITITKQNGSYLYSEGSRPAVSGTASSIFPKPSVPIGTDGVRMIGDGTLVEVKDGKVVKWIKVYQKRFDALSLPGFGEEKKAVFQKSTVSSSRESGQVKDWREPLMTSSTSQIPLYQLKVSNDKFPYGIILDPSKILNEQLSKDELFSTGPYGIGSAEAPQELGTVFRYAKTDLDTETYYIIEGVRPDANTNSMGDAGASKEASGGGGGGGGWYRLPHAVGAITVFIRMLVKIFSKLIPSIMKLLKLFKSPLEFVSDIVMEKIGQSFSVFSPEALKKFEGAKEIIKRKKDYTKPQRPAQPGMPASPVPKIGDYVKLMKGHFQNSKLRGHIAVDSLGNFKDALGNPPKLPPKEAIGNFKFVADGVGFIPFKIFGKDLSFGLELKMANIITKEWGNPVPMRLIFDKEKNSPEGDAQKAAKVAPDSGASAADAAAGAQQQASTDRLANAKRKRGSLGSSDPNEQYAVVSTWYSTGEFVPGVDYKYIYKDQEDEALLDEVDRLAGSIDPEELEKAKRLLEDAIAKDPSDEALATKLDQINTRIKGVNGNTQPLLKFLLGLVTLPIKVIAGVIEWIMNFFKSLTNPMMLPAKIIEFLSFKWIMDFFSPKGLLKLAGIDFDFSKVPQWIAMAKMPNPMKNMDPVEFAKAKASGLKPDLKDPSKGAADKAKAAAEELSPEKAKAAAAEKAGGLKKEVPLHKDSYALPDDFELGNLPEFLNIAFMAKLPTYSSKDIRERGAQITSRLFQPTICFIEKLINGFIDFIWSTLGIEVIIPAPHLKLCSSDDPEAVDPEELKKIMNGESPGATASGSDPEAAATTEVTGTNPFTSQNPPLEKYVYEVKLPDGTTKTFIDRESLDAFMQESRDLGFDLQF